MHAAPLPLWAACSRPTATLSRSLGATAQVQTMPRVIDRGRIRSQARRVHSACPAAESTSMCARESHTGADRMKRRSAQHRTPVPTTTRAPNPRMEADLGESQHGKSAWFIKTTHKAARIAKPPPPGAGGSARRQNTKQLPGWCGHHHHPWRPVVSGPPKPTQPQPVSRIRSDEVGSSCMEATNAQLSKRDAAMHVWRFGV